MRSRWLSQKQKAIKLRFQGISIRDIEKLLGIPRSTLSGWLRDVVLTPSQRTSLEENRKNALGVAREKAAQWHKDGRQKRIGVAKNEAQAVLNKINTKNIEVLELALAVLYFGEGTKKEKGLVLGNANPELLKFFIACLEQVYHIDRNRIRCELHLRADQSSSDAISYWSRNLNIPKEQFRGVYVDKRTAGQKTYTTYKGVCVVSYYDVALQRKLMYLYELYCREVINRGG
jgi:transposase